MANNISKLILCLILLASLVSAGSIKIDSTDSIPSGTLWTIAVEYDVDSENEVKIFLDNELLITLFEYNGKVFVDETQNSSKVLNFNASNSELTLSIAGLKEGTYNFDAKLYLKEEKIDSDSIEIDFYNLQNKIISLENTIKTQSITIQNLRNDLNAKALEIEKLKINNQITIESLRQITSNVTTLQESDLDKNNSLEKINSDLGLLLKETELETGLTGLFGFTQNPLSWVALIGIIALIGVSVVFYTHKKKKESLY